MQFSTALLFSIASIGALAAPSVNTDKVVHHEGLTLKLADENTILRLGEDGEVIDTSPITSEQLAEFETMMNQPLRRDETHLVERACLLGLPCSTAAECWFNGCDGCMSGGCFGSLY